ncbi:hypothetical protein [Aliivibrio sp. SR45-2]|uniref:hypothetical protein n=1 Tax=Aliivibrio sp. SR45-2 TaxID=2760931 RepID=UPI0015FDE675|nr:hypothetical protein [Aliivibrio sp. SR45-2]MBB1313442.1 hypothetical protein [Aliivibrio sp. SR45-2]
MIIISPTRIGKSSPHRLFWVTPSMNSKDNVMKPVQTQEIIDNPLMSLSWKPKKCIANPNWFNNRAGNK